MCFFVCALKTTREERVRWSDGGTGGRMGAVIAQRRQGLWILSLWTHTHRLGTQISEQFSGRMIGSLMRILPLQDLLITPAIPFHAAVTPSLLSFSHSHHLFSFLFFFVTVTLSTPPCPDPLLLPSLIPLSILLSPSLSLSLLACCGAITMTEAIRDIYHMCGGVSERKPSTGLGGGTRTHTLTHTHTHTHIQHIEIYRNTHTHTACTQMCKHPCTFMHINTDK